MATEMLMSYETIKESYNNQRKVAETIPIENLQAYVNGLRVFGKTIRNWVYKTSPKARAIRDALTKRKSKLEDIS